MKRNVNDFLEDYEDEEILDIKYSVATLYDGRSQVYCYSCMIIIKNPS